MANVMTSLAMRALAKVRAHILESVTEVNEMTASGTMAAGKRLQHVVAVATSTIAELGATLAGGGTRDGDLVQAIRSLAERTRTHNEAMLAAVANNVAQVARVSEHLESIACAARKVKSLNAAASLLSLNARIETNRLGEKSGTFKTIADEMQQLSRAISAANTEITVVADAMAHVLPTLRMASAGLATRVGEFAQGARDEILTVDQRVNELQGKVHGALEAGDRALADIVSTSYACISDLQFQDVCAQKLRLIDRALVTADREVATTLGVPPEEIDAEVAAPEYQILGNDAPITAPAGDVLMF